MRQACGALPPRFHMVAKEPVNLKLKSPLGAIGLVLFPEGPVPGKGPAKEQVEAALKAGKALRSACVLVIGVSPWGYVGERDFLPKAEGIFDCIFGGGEGVGFGFSVPEKTPRILWLRPDSQGRAINMLELLEKPDPKSRLPWVEGKSFNASLEFLHDEYPSDPAMLKLVGTPE